MGLRSSVICRRCDRQFDVYADDNPFIQVLRCDTCGQGETLIDLERHGRRITDLEYEAELSARTRDCSCGGRVVENAPVRCPVCASERVFPDPEDELAVY